MLPITVLTLVLRAQQRNKNPIRPNKQSSTTCRFEVAFGASCCHRLNSALFREIYNMGSRYTVDDSKWEEVRAINGYAVFMGGRKGVGRLGSSLDQCRPPRWLRLRSREEGLLVSYIDCARPNCWVSLYLLYISRIFIN